VVWLVEVFEKPSLVSSSFFYMEKIRFKEMLARKPKETP
jgi:hypothetical protein